MLNADTLEVLAQINNVTNTIILKHPQTVAVSESQDIRVLIDLSGLDPEGFDPIGLNDSLSNFLNLFKLFPDDRRVEILDNTINVSAGQTSSSFIMDNTDLMEAYDVGPEQFAKTEQVPSVGTFNLDVPDIKSIRAATKIFGDLSEVIFTSQDGDMIVSLGSTNKFNAKSNKFSVTKQAQTTKEFEVKIPVENFGVIPQSDYTVDIKHNPSNGQYRIMLTSKSLEGLKLIMSVKV